MQVWLICSLALAGQAGTASAAPDHFSVSKWAGPLSPASGWQFVRGDFNGDGKADLAGYAPSNGTVWVLRSTGTGFSTSRWAGPISPHGGWQFFPGDFNGDGKADLAGYAPSNGTLWVERSTGSGFSASKWQTFSPAAGWQMVPGDFNGDGKSDLAGYYAGNGTLWGEISNGTRFSGSKWQTFSPAAGWQMVPGDFNGDGKSDLAGYYAGNGTLWGEISNGTRFNGARWAGPLSPTHGWQFFPGNYNGDTSSDLMGYAPENGTLWGFIATAPSGVPRGGSGACDTRFDDQWLNARQVRLSVKALTRGCAYQFVPGSHCAAAHHLSTNPGPYTLTLPAITQATVMLCARRPPYKWSFTIKDMVSPVYRYAPLVHFKKGESYYPDATEHFIAHSELVLDKPDFGDPSCSPITLVPTGHVDPGALGAGRSGAYHPPDWVPHNVNRGVRCRKNGKRLSTAGPPAQTAKSSDISRAGIKLVLTDNALIHGDKEVSSASPPPVYTVFVPGDPQFHRDGFVVYWFFYDYNHFVWKKEGVTEFHQGDWEHVIVRLNPYNRTDPTDVHTGVGYFQHTCNAKFYTWSHTPRTADDRPVVFAARGGHASYPNAGMNYLGDGCGHAGFEGAGDVRGSDGRDWLTWRHIVDAATQPWWGYGGNWGDKVPSTFSRYGPVGPGPYRLGDGPGG